MRIVTLCPNPAVDVSSAAVMTGGTELCHRADVESLHAALLAREPFEMASPQIRA